MEEVERNLNYERTSVLSKCDNVILEAKRVIINDHLDKIAHITLSEVDNSRKCIENCMKQCKNSLSLRDEAFWLDLPPNPKNPVNKSNHIDPLQTTNHLPVEIIQNLMVSTRNEPVKTTDLRQKYFMLWQEVVKMRKEKNAVLENRIKQKEKLDNLVRTMKRYRKQELHHPTRESPRKTTQSERSRAPEIFKNRYTAQKNIINMQKAKLEEQNKLIEELKLGIIREDLLKSIENTKSNIREIFSNCSSTTKCKVPVIILTERQDFKVTTQKAPKIVQQLEQRALERAQKRRMILERKRLIEEARQRLLEEAIENKRVLEEEERRRSLAVIKERRKKELELEKVRQANKQKYLDSLNKAVNFYNTLLLERCFRQLYDNFIRSRNNRWLALEHYERKLLKKSIVSWCDLVEDSYKLKYELADAHFTYTILKKVLKTWRDVHIESVRNMQVAEDVYDFRLVSNTFIHWHRHVCSQIMLQDKLLKVAKRHYERRLLFHYFYLWRSLPAVIQLEKAKELKKRKWREKVWEIVPDYKPPEDV
ncbi:hypothetical protein NQ315_011842 [Exocentrus adspersus]|uniref:Sfi1 spindle body domain-containing protein n=1 Tax=Exocentrus adspersus TaxID=1586481 RepID=A0AAV8W270_9CUCU|nr:hypothetical protein NQ315_011842 [Exocentrus adspersus]